MDESHIEATQALDFGDDETDEDIDLNTPVAHLNVRCQKGFPGKLFPIFEGDNVIGRHDECQVAIPLKALSREHACIEVKSGSHFIYDKGSRNRTKRNAHFLAAAVRYELKDKDKLIFGDVECEYQLQTGNDDGSETESESMFQTAPADEDYHSDASSDILEPTQPFTKTTSTQSILGTKTQLGETTIEQNISVEDTPEPNRTKKFTENVVVPESGSDTDGEDEFQKGVTETSADKSSILIAETQSYVCESDVTTDNEDDVGDKSSLLVAPTQAFIHGDDGDDGDDDISTCSEASPEKKHLMMAATQAYVGESDDSESPKKKLMFEPTQTYTMDVGVEPTVSEDGGESEESPKKKLMFEPTQAYTMDVGVEPTVGYKMDGEDGSETEDEDEKPSGILFEPTQAYAGNDPEADTDDGNDSEASEEFDEPVGFDDPTLAVENVFSEDKITKSSAVTVVSETQEFENQSDNIETKTSAPVTDANAVETQVFEEVTENNDKASAAAKKTNVPVNDANVVETQVFEDVTNVTENNNKDDTEEKKTEKVTQGFDKQTAPTQTMSDDDDDDTFDFLVTSTLAVDSVDSEESNQSADRQPAEVENDQSTQVFDNADETCAVTEDMSKTDGDKHKKKVCSSKKVNANDDATQVFDDTVGVQEDATVAIDTDVKSGRKSKKQIMAEADPAAHGDEQTQVFDETVAVDEIPEKDKKVSKTILENSTEQSATEDSTQVFDETVPVDEMTEGVNPAVNVKNHATEDATQVFDETVAVEDIPEETKPTKGGKKGSKKATKVSEQSAMEDATQVFDETVAVEDIPEETKPTRGGKKGSKKATKVSEQSAMEDATQVFDETVAIEDIPEETKPTKGGKKGSKKATKVTETSPMEDATQVFDETVAVEDIHEEAKPTRGGKKVSKNTSKATEPSPMEDATQVFDETVAIEDIPEEIKPTKGGKKGSKKATKVSEQSAMEDATQVFDETVAVECIEQSIEPECKSDTIKNLSNVSGKTGRNEPEVPETDEKVSIRKSGRKKQTDAGKSETSNSNVVTSSTVRTGQSRTRGSKTSNNDNDDVSKNEKPNPTKTDEVKETDNVRKSGRNSSKMEADNTEDKPTNTGRKSARNKKNVSKKDADDAPDDSVGKATRKGRKKESNQQIVEPEADTQIYAEDDTADGAATQRYGDDESVDGDVTPDIETVLAQEANQSNNPVVETVIPAKSPLKSALAGPKKERSPSPKKVQFVSQKSETESESSENTRRSKRANKGKAKVRLGTEESKPVPKNKNKKEDKHTDSAVVTPEDSEDKADIGKSTRGGKRGVRSLEPVTEDVTVCDNVENTTDSVPVTSRRQGRSVKDNSVKQKSEDKVEESKEKSETVDTSKVVRRGGRRSTNTCSNVEVKQETSRVTRTSLPSVLEENTDENTKDNDKTVKGRASKRKIEVTNVSKESNEKQTVSEVVKNAPTGSRRSKRQNKDEDSDSVKIQETQSKDNAAINDLRPSRRGTRHKEHSDSMADESENTKTDIQKSKVKAVKNESKSDTTQDETVVNRRGKKDSAVKSSKSDSDSQVLQVQENGSGNKRSSRRKDGGDNDSASDKKIDNSKVKNNKIVDNLKVKNDKTIDNSEVKEGNDMAGTKKTLGRLKRKESASSSNDSQESELGETPAKKQRRGKAPAISTPVSSNKQKSFKQLEESVSHSPTLRKSTIEGVKAKVMFTGVVDEHGQKIVKDLGGELVNSVIDCTHLVTDQVRRTVKFLCCLARGIPIVVPQWLISSKASGFFVDSVPFLVTDDASQRKFKFRLDQSIEKANKKRMFDGYTVHVTKSVKPEPAQMKDILKCAGAEYCDTMPASTRSGHVVVISCIEDKALCTHAVKAGIPVMSAEFVLTGILRQDVDLVSFKLDIGAEGNKRSLPENQSEPSKKRKR